jgi:sugar/nucleoside kinase (ribokinase family)
MIDRALDALAGLPATPRPIVVGFDGFVDEMIRVVGERTSLESYEAVPDILTFGSLVSAAAGHSSLREIVVEAVHPGGCAVNLGDGLAAAGIPVDCFATLGDPVHPAFRETLSRFRKVASWGEEPGRTLAFEFADGKLMFSSVRQLTRFTPESVLPHIGDGAYLASCREAGVIALTNWSLYPHMTAVWGMLQREIYSNLAHRPHFFIDLVDPSSRSAGDIRGMLQALPAIERCGPVTLGLNGNEANILARLLGLEPAGDSEEECLRLARALRPALGISSVVIHRLRFAASDGPAGAASASGPFCAQPLKSTGAGDRFNAGYCIGLLADADPEACLDLGSAASGFFVRNARSASRSELAEFLAGWRSGKF